MNTIDTPLTEADADQIIDWLESGDALVSTDGLRLILPDGWTIEIEPDGDVDDYGRPVDCSTAVVYRYSKRLTDIDPYERDIYSEASIASRLAVGYRPY